MGVHCVYIDEEQTLCDPRNKMWKMSGGLNTFRMHCRLNYDHTSVALSMNLRVVTFLSFLLKQGRGESLCDCFNCPFNFMITRYSIDTNNYLYGPFSLETVPLFEILFTSWREGGRSISISFHYI